VGSAPILWKRIARYDHGDVIASSAIERELDEVRAGVGRPTGSRERIGDRLVIDEVAEPVAAQEQTIAVLEAQQIDVDIDVLAGAAERVREDVAYA
jgi:hypothetical protein